VAVLGWPYTASVLTITPTSALLNVHCPIPFVAAGGPVTIASFLIFPFFFFFGWFFFYFYFRGWLVSKYLVWPVIEIKDKNADPIVMLLP
jgi:hypothetical protein